ncbi:MAG: hypothetical protein AMS16_02535 [Planctomycetes bacterium DG_58]|nr:MAG: hypothetical protein AMS16_02535 [Planctomycetes bacterium DG_58]
MKTAGMSLFLCLVAAVASAQTKVIDSMDDIALWKTNHTDNRITFSADAQPKEGQGAVHLDSQVATTFAIIYRRLKPGPDWNGYDGFVFWVKGDGSKHFGDIRIQAGSWNRAWLGNFPLKDTHWHEVKLAWRDLVPAGAGTPELGTADGFRPTDLDFIAFGKSWNFNTRHQRPKLAFSIDELRLVKGIQPNRPRRKIETFPAVSTVVAKMKAREPVTVLALGDSITWGTSAGGNRNAYPALLGEMLRKHYRNDKIEIVSRAIGGSTTAKGRQWLNRDVRGVEADLITIMFGFNEMAQKPEERETKTKAFTANLVTYAEEAAGVMKTAPACVLLATIPGNGKHWESLDCYAEGVRELGRRHKNLTVADVNAHFKKMGFEKFKTLMADGAHPNRNGQREMAKVVFEAITGEKPPE